MLFRWLKRYMPRSLYGRAALILVLPVAVLLLVVSVVFIQRHLEDVTTQMTLTAARELAVLREGVARSENLPAAQAELAPLLDVFQMRLEPARSGEADLTDRKPWYDYSGSVVRRTLRGHLDGIIAIWILENNDITVFFSSKFGAIEVTFNRRRVTVAAPHQLIVTMVFFGILMTLISFVYMRNQLRPITRLADAAQAFGRGRMMPYAPAGALEVRAAGGAFLDMRARIERQIEQRTMMLSGVSHDLRTPLTRMKLGLSMMDSEDAAPLLSDVDEMQRLVDGFLDFSKGANEGEPEEIDPHALVREVVDSQIRAGQPVALCETSGEGTIMARPTALRRAVQNLIGNAVRYGGKVEVAVVLTDKSLRIRVEDDGPGIPESQREEALKPFARLDPARNQNLGGGVGLGLAIVNDVARAHGGVLRLGHSERLRGLRADIVIAR